MSLHKLLAIFALSAGLSACSQSPSTKVLDAAGSEQGLYALTGQEHQVHFKALYRSNAQSVEELNAYTLVFRIQETTRFFFGPLTIRNLGGIQKGERITPHLDEAYVENGRVIVPYSYDATWMIHRSALRQNSPRLALRLPLPYAVPDLETLLWQNCTDSGEGHNTWDFFWYFWDPERPGCDHRANVHYQDIDVEIGTETPQTARTYPEYPRMIRDINGTPTLAMTFAFGYVEDPARPNPFRDRDYGMQEFRRFHSETQRQLLPLGFRESPLLQSEFTHGNTVIGSKFTGLKQGVKVEVSVVAAAGVDQMDLFAHSYARNHEAFFGWFGHSRVGSGFDARSFEYKLRNQTQKYSLTQDYQLIYWAGCNSYSYYTLPFFELKAQLDPQADPRGTRHLDLISNTLPSLFAFNAANAQVLFQALLHWDEPTSYQEMIRQIEKTGTDWRTEVIVNVLGDEDNP